MTRFRRCHSWNIIAARLLKRAAIIFHEERNSVALHVAEIGARISSPYLAAAGYLTMRVTR